LAKCSRCNQRKAKRYCPALGSSLCPLCCGLIREKRINCPPNCPFLSRHKPYQESKIIHKRQAFSEDVAQNERLLWLTLHIEAPIKEYADKNPVFVDKDALLALDYAKAKIEKGKSKLVLPEGENSPKNEVGEAIFRSIEGCRYQRAIILPQQVEIYKKEEKLACLDNVILGLKYLAKDDLNGRTYIADLSDRFAKVKELSRQKRLITPP
jgi:hypothetical protein